MYRNWRELIRPDRLDSREINEMYGKFEAKPLERGYGQTLGNALRRVLLSTIRGSAIAALKIEGVDHEFSSIPDVKEDVNNLVLNLKGLNLKYYGDDDKIIEIDFDGPGIIKGKDIIHDESVEIMNQEHELATVNKGGKLKAQMWVRNGVGYMVSESHVQQTDFPIGTIPIDAIFSPVRRVTFKVDNTRVGHATDYDRLVMEVWTNGCVNPADAVAFSAKILKEQLTVFINFQEEDEPEPVKQQEETQKLNENLFKPVDELELSVRSANCLENANIKFIGELVVRTESEMLKTKNFGRKSLNDIKDILAEMGLSLGMKIDGFDPSVLRNKEEDKNEEKEEI